MLDRQHVIIAACRERLAKAAPPGFIMAVAEGDVIPGSMRDVFAGLISIRPSRQGLGFEAGDRPWTVFDDDGVVSRPMHGHGPLRARSKHLGDEPEGVVGILVVPAVLPLWQLDLLARQLLVGDLAQDVLQDVEPCPPLVVGMDDVPRRP